MLVLLNINVTIVVPNSYQVIILVVDKPVVIDHKFFSRKLITEELLHIFFTHIEVFILELNVLYHHFFFITVLCLLSELLRLLSCLLLSELLRLLSCPPAVCLPAALLQPPPQLPSSQRAPPQPPLLSSLPPQLPLLSELVYFLLTLLP